jgi:hypothetical protein
MKQFKSLRRSLRRGKARLIPDVLGMRMHIQRRTGRGTWQTVSSM